MLTIFSSLCPRFWQAIRKIVLLFDNNLLTICNILCMPSLLFQKLEHQRIVDPYALQPVHFLHAPIEPVASNCNRVSLTFMGRVPVNIGNEKKQLRKKHHSLQD